MTERVNAGPDFAGLYGMFPDPEGPPLAEVVPAHEVPEPYRGLLVHTHHMTVTVEQFHGSLVGVRVLDSRLEGDTYCRKILLVLQGTDRVVQFGAVRIHLNHCEPAVREAILAQQTPLGRILIERGVLRSIHPTAYLKVIPNASMRGWFGMDSPATTYGRLGVITTDGRPAIEVLEVVAPVGGLPASVVLTTSGSME